MNNKTLFKVSLLSLALSSCGYLDRWKTPDQPSDSTASTDVSRGSSSTTTSDDIFRGTMNELDADTFTDDPTEIAGFTEELIDVREQEIGKIEETIPQIQVAETNVNSDAGMVKTYKVKKGETLMQIAFKLYGDIARWKELRTLNPGIKVNAITAGTAIKYRVPETVFSWNPVGTPYLIKQGDTLGIISNGLYATPSKWKSIWNNNKPLIKNPNLIYAGFTLYTLDGSMANTVHPNQGYTAEDLIDPNEEVITAQRVIANELPAVEEFSADELVDETIQTLSATQRKAIEQAINTPAEAEIDLVNNISVPHGDDDIDFAELEEVQILE